MQRQQQQEELHDAGAQQQHATNAEEEVGSAAFTCRMTAAFRVLDGADGARPPICQDPLADKMAGTQALRIARADWQALVEAQGPGKHLRVPARNRILDDDLVTAVGEVRAAADAAAAAAAAATASANQQQQQQQGQGQQQRTRIQVVNLGAGMDTRPWRLPLPGVHYWCVDQPSVMQLKVKLLEQAGAQLHIHDVGVARGCDATGAGASEPFSSAPPAEGAAAGEGGPTSTSAGPTAAQPAFPLTVDSWCGLGVDLAHTPLEAALTGAGFVAGAPTVWVAEALLYYLQLPQALELLAALARLSGPSSMLLATCIDRALLEWSAASRGHYFAKLWHFCLEDLEPSIGEERGDGAWEVAAAPQTTRHLALQRYGADTYVALYGGAEYVLSCRRRSR